jgi:hypothetical protein
MLTQADYSQLPQKGGEDEAKEIFDYRIDLFNWSRTRHHTGTGKKTFSGCLEG